MESNKKVDDDGMTTVAYMLASALSLIVLTWCAMFIIVSYSRAAIRGASDRATRAAIANYAATQDVDSTLQVCADAFESDLNQAVPGSMRNSIKFECRIDSSSIVVSTWGSLDSVGAMFVGSGFNESTRRAFESRP